MPRGNDLVRELAGDLSRRATNLTTGESLTGDPSLASRNVTPLDAFICEPDPAVIRAGLLETLADNHSFSRIDYEEEYRPLLKNLRQAS